MAPPTGRILTVNAGSSSLKLRILDADDRIVSSRDCGPVQGQEELSNELAAILAEGGTVDAAGHRVVHGGPEHAGPALLDASVEEELGRLADLAPLHNPPALDAIRALKAELPGLPNVACFDTAFHAQMPAAASTYAVPEAWRERWPLRRLGFHGLSNAYASRRAAELLGRPLAGLRMVIAHLGSGASLCAVVGGRSLDTTMGFTPLEGLVMATRSGSVDPGLLLWVQRHGEIDAEEMERALDRESGLLALSGRSGDMREVLAGAGAGDERCRLAFNAYCHRLVAGIAAMAAASGGLDALVFTGGVGEHIPEVRAAAAAGAAFLGVDLDLARNDDYGGGDAILSPAGAPIATMAVTAREDLEIARGVRDLLSKR
ncbi:MAG TPA: acetate/propionate family kinase [Solirubrobacterales bacterium]|nr:acetate/propionate family kinase [Solirubrobacterales bacterium]